MIQAPEADIEFVDYPKRSWPFAPVQEAVTLTDHHFGVFTLDRRWTMYEATPSWCASSVRLAIHAGTPDEMEKSLAVARRLWAKHEAWQRKVTTCAIQALFELNHIDPLYG